MCPVTTVPGNAFPGNKIPTFIQVLHNDQIIVGHKVEACNFAEEGYDCCPWLANNKYVDTYGLLHIRGIKSNSFIVISLL